MHDESTPVSSSSASPNPIPSKGIRGEVGCQHCGLVFRQRSIGQRFCSRECYQDWWTANRQQEMAAKGTQRLVEIVRESGDEAERVRAQIADRNRRVAARKAGKRSPQLRIPAARLTEVEDDGLTDDTAWAERGRYWEGETHQIRARHAANPAQRKAEGLPLVLTGHGVRLQVHQGTLLIRDGFTHYPQSRKEYRYFPGDRKLPSRIIVLDGDGSISFNVLNWLTEQEIVLVMLDWKGNVRSVVGGNGVAPDPTLRQAQMAALTNGVGLGLATELIRQKVAGSQETLLMLPSSPTREVALQKLEWALSELQAVPESMEALRIIEARAALTYFTCWQSIPLRWKGTGRKPVPEEWKRMGLRQSLVSGTNRNASHPVNAILNYAYGVLESQVRIAAVASGLDPTIGYLHANRPGRVALVYDLMEPMRSKVDHLVLTFLLSHTFSSSDVLQSSSGSCRLHPDMARSIGALFVRDADVYAVIRATIAHFSEYAVQWANQN